MPFNRFRKITKETLIQERIRILLKDHRAFSKRKLYSMAKTYVEHHYPQKQ